MRISYNPEYGDNDAFDKYVDLIDEVYEIDEEAAFILCHPEEYLAKFHYTGFLAGAFVWEDSIHGFDYWNGIAIKIFNNKEWK